jgi:tRNA A37 threonylcarbamoyladenosine synthetase subunit TsaC/SUA5/YrdC
MSKDENGNTENLLALKNLIPERHARIEQAPAVAVDTDAMKILTARLHPHRQYLRIDAIKAETDSTKTFRLVADIKKGTPGLAVFRAGQYLSVKAGLPGPIPFPLHLKRHVKMDSTKSPSGGCRKGF